MKYHLENGCRWREGSFGPEVMIRYPSENLPESRDGFAIEWWRSRSPSIEELAFVVRCPVDFQPNADSLGNITEISQLLCSLYRDTGCRQVIQIVCEPRVMSRINKAMHSAANFQSLPRIVLKSEDAGPQLFHPFTGDPIPIRVEVPRPLSFVPNLHLYTPLPDFYNRPMSPDARVGDWPKTYKMPPVPYLPAPALLNGWEDMFRDLLARLDCARCKTLSCPNPAQPNLGLCQSCWRKIPAAQRRKLWGEHKEKFRAIESQKGNR